MKYWPDFLTPRVVDETFRVELVERFRELSGTVTVRNGQDLPCLLEKSLFQTGLRYTQIAMSKGFDTWASDLQYTGLTLSEIKKMI